MMTVAPAPQIAPGVAPQPAPLTMRDAALRYAQRGYPVIPLCWPNADGSCGCPRHHQNERDVGKAPLTPRAHLDATTDPEQIRRWWQRWPDANIGIALAPAGLISIAPDCPEAASAFEQRGLPPTLRFTSGGGAGHFHAIYKRPAGCPADRICKSGEYDLLADGYVVAPPSLHRSGRRYAWVKTISAIPPAPAWAVAMLQAHADRAPRQEPAISWPAVEQWGGNLAPLMHDDGMPRRFKSHWQSYRLLRGDIVPVNAQGVADESTWRAFLARGCAYARYPHDAAAAILWRHTSESYRERKGTAWHKADIERVIAKQYAAVTAQIENYQIRPITAAELRYGKTDADPVPIPQIARKSRARADRPQRFTPARLLATYQERPELCAQKRKRRAAELGISTATLDRLEDSLESLGLIIIETDARRQGSRVLLQVGVINIEAQAPPEHPPEPPIEVLSEAPVDATNSRAGSDENANQCAMQGDTHRGGESPQRPPLRGAELRAIISRALIALRYDQATGERTTRRVTFARIAEAIEDAAPGRPYSRDMAARILDSERRRRAWAQQVESLPTMPQRRLTKLQKCVDRILTGGESGPEAARYAWASWMAPHLADEWERRSAAHDRLRSRRKGERAVSVDERLMLAEIEEQRAPQTLGIPSGGVCPPPNPRPVVVQPALFSDTPTPGTRESLLTSLRANLARSA